MSGNNPDIHIVVSGFKDCPYYHKALAAAKKVAEERENVTVEDICLTREEFHEHRKKILKNLGHAETYHTTCPLVYSSHKNVPAVFYGGCDRFLDICRTEFQVEP